MQKESAADQELILKKRARRRLVGALALVLLMVTILPMVLKDRSQETSEEQVKITLSNDIPSSAPSAEANEKPADFDSSVIPKETDQHMQPEVSVTENAKPEEVIDTAKVDHSVKQENKIAAKSDEYISDSGKKYYIQVGVFSDAANVKRLQAKLNELGYSSTTEKINTPNGVKTRLKTKMFAERNEAATALENIKSAGLTGMVVSQ